MNDTEAQASFPVISMVRHYRVSTHMSPASFSSIFWVDTTTHFPVLPIEDFGTSFKARAFLLYAKRIHVFCTRAFSIFFPE
jgi:hypothetical protein